MLADLTQFLGLSIEFVVVQLVTVLAYPITAGQRIFVLYIFSSCLLAFYVFYVKNRLDPGRNVSFRAFIGYLFPKYIWRNPSAWLDVRYFFFHQMFRLVIYGVFLAGLSNLLFQIITGGPSLIEAGASTPGPGVTGFLISAAYMIVLIGFGDFVGYGLHYMQHRVPLLWEFHKVHHSLEVMHPLSNYREHPVDNIFYASGIGVAYGLVMGLTANLFGYVPSMPQLLGVPLLMFAFNILGYNLRHSHVWLRWPGRWSMLFGSPAHHHIHHSCHPDHVDRNFAFIFPCWDVLFGTYHLPETDKDVRFGLSMDYVTEYKSCLGIYFIPFKNAWRRFANGSTEKLTDPPS